MRAFLLPLSAFWVSSVAAAGVGVLANGGFGAGDLDAFALWSLAAAVLASSIRRVTVALLPGGGARWARLAVSVALGVSFGVVATWLLGWVMGAWLGTLSVPVLSCWVLGGVAAFGLPLALRDRILAPPAAVLAVLAFTVALLYSNSMLSARDVWLVEMQADASSSDVERLLREASPRSPGPSAVIRAVSRNDEGGAAVIRVELEPDATDSQRDRLRSLLIALPKIARVSEAQ